MHLVELYEIAMIICEKSLNTGNFKRFKLILALEYESYFVVEKETSEGWNFDNRNTDEGSVTGNSQKSP